MLWTKQQHFCFLTMFSLFLEVSGWLKAFGLVAVWAEIQTCVCPVADGFVSLPTPHCHSLNAKGSCLSSPYLQEILSDCRVCTQCCLRNGGYGEAWGGWSPILLKTSVWWEGGQSANRQTKQCERFALMKEVRETQLTACKWLVQLKGPNWNTPEA